jgi:hypothetical protein
MQIWSDECQNWYLSGLNHDQHQGLFAAMIHLKEKYKQSIDLIKIIKITNASCIWCNLSLQSKLQGAIIAYERKEASQCTRIGMGSGLEGVKYY